MKLQNRFTRAAAIVMAAVALTFTTGFTSASCNSKTANAAPEQRDAARTLAKASDDLAGGIKLAVTTKRKLAEQRLLDRDEEVKLTELMLDVNRAGSAYNDTLRSITGDTGDDRASLLTALEGVSSSVERLHNEGVLRIKSEKARTQVGLAVGAARAAIATIRLTIQQTPPASPPPSPAGSKGLARGSYNGGLSRG